MPAISRPHVVLGLVVLTAGIVTMVGLGRGEHNKSESPAVSWAPAPRTANDIAVVATAGDGRYALRTKHGEVGFLAGVNLGATTPGRQPGELAISASHYRRWLAEMGALGLRSVRIYTIHPPAFYDELERYNRAHPNAPLYLIQGVYLPDETYNERERGLYDEGVDGAFASEIADAVKAVHGELERAPARGRVEGRWRADVSAWLAGWIIGVEWDPYGVELTDRSNSSAPHVRGRFFRSTAAATPTERWLARHLNQLAALELAHGVSMPLAFTNWPTTDPLSHPTEPLPQEDRVGVDANHVVATRAWPGGTFASYHAYPYYPDFQRHEPRLKTYELDGKVDPYAGYLAALRDHHGKTPVMVTEFGVPASIGYAHEGPLDRDQGGHTEQEALAIDAELLRVIHRQGLSGAFLFSWIDEWFKFTWNTLPRQAPVAERRQLWHDPWTNEQWFGLKAADAGPPEPTGRVVQESRGEVREIRLATDPSWLHLRVHLENPPTGPLRLGFDVVPGGAAALPGASASDGESDYAIVLDPEAGAGQAYVRSELDPVPLDFSPLPEGVLQTQNGWNRMLLSTNRELTVPTTGERFPYETMNVGALRAGSWNPSSEDYDSLATWRVDGQDVVVRVPWMQLGIVDPSSRQALVPVVRDGVSTATTVPVPSIGLHVVPARGASATARLTWEIWNVVAPVERLKQGAGIYADALRALEDP